MRQIVETDAGPELTAALGRFSRRYCWDSNPEDAVREASRVILRTMNIGTWEDMLELERVAGKDLLASLLGESTAGALTPRAWSFWHYRLGLADIDRAPPARPTRRVR